MSKYSGTVYRDVGHIGKRVEEELKKKAVQMARRKGWVVPAAMLTEIKEEEGEHEMGTGGATAAATMGMPASSSSSSMGVLLPGGLLPGASDAATTEPEVREVVVGEDVYMVGAQSVEQVEDLGALKGWDIKWTSETIVVMK